ncbi:hypothetical protein BUALT_Bualt06G0009300 [Buddleja alternifolia]|uniref:Protein kinase domain-containing protein n=1 Tax=Buddleja alternifolia TaxID=168488 RepID=A0AAV6XD30_9LAMI|nr:hypothetical protein BUALT_Bualt06G0009300 [Buddleja alternifolia]
MGCFPCCRRKKGSLKGDHLPTAQAKIAISQSHDAPVCYGSHQTPLSYTNNNAEDGNNTAIAFAFRELAVATKNFRQECLIGEGGVGRVFKGTLQSSGQIVAVRQLDRSGTQGGKEFQVEVLMLSLLSHPNIVKIIGYCADGDQRLLVYEYIPSGSLKNRLFDVSGDKRPLDWTTRMKIAAGVAQGLEYLHEKANPAIIYRDLKSSNIMLDETNNPRLSEYGLAKLFQSGNKMHVSSYGYCAPEYERNGELTLKSDVYSFGVVLLELITGRRAFDNARPTMEQNLASWVSMFIHIFNLFDLGRKSPVQPDPSKSEAQPFFRDPKTFPDMADPLLERKFLVTSLNQAVGVASMCLQEEPSVRPLITDVVAALSFLAMAPPEAPIPTRLVPMLSSRVEITSQGSYGERQEDSEEEYSSEGEDDTPENDPEEDSDVDTNSEQDIIHEPRERSGPDPFRCELPHPFTVPNSRCSGNVDSEYGDDDPKATKPERRNGNQSVNVLGHF